MELGSFPVATVSIIFPTFLQNENILRECKKGIGLHETYEDFYNYCDYVMMLN